MATVVIDMSISLDGFVAGPNDGPEHPLGERGGERIFDWYRPGASRSTATRGSDQPAPTGQSSRKCSLQRGPSFRVAARTTSRAAGVARSRSMPFRCTS